MKNLKLAMLIGIAALLTGCAKEKSQSAPSANQTVAPDCRGCLPTATGGGSSSTPITSLSGSTVDLRVTANASTCSGCSLANFVQYFFDSKPNSPTNIKINVDLTRERDAVVIAYDDGGRSVRSQSGTMHPDTQITSNHHNKWYSQSGAPVWKGFFQDRYGAIVVIINRVISTGDGSILPIVGGSVWFQNFDQYWPNNPVQGPQLLCWDMGAGPYDCRSFLVNGAVNMTSSLYPNNYGQHRFVGYKKLGEFDGLNSEVANF